MREINLFSAARGVTPDFVKHLYDLKGNTQISFSFYDIVKELMLEKIGVNIYE